MPLTEEEKQWVSQTLGSTQPPPQTSAPGTLPPGLPVGRPYLSSGKIGNARVTIPPPPEEIQRQIAVEQAKQAGKPASSTIQRDFSRIESFEGVLKDLEKLSQSVPKGPLQGRYAGVGSKITGGGEFPGITESQSIGANTYNAMRPGVAAGLYRAVTGDDRISDMDAAQRALPFVPGLDLTPKAFQERLKLIRSAIQRRKQSIQEAKRLGMELPPADFQMALTSTSGTPETSTEDPRVVEARRRGLIP